MVATATPDKWFDGTFAEFLRAAPAGTSDVFPYAHLVPRFQWRGTRNEFDQPDEGQWDWSANLAFRAWINNRGEHDKQDRRLIFEVCEKDPLFFINSFLMIKQESPVPADLPFLTWGRQEEYLALSVGKRRWVEADMTGRRRYDIASEKPREVGWTWLNLAEGLHIARFVKGATALIGSRVDYDVDKRGASKTLFWKLDYFIEHLPLWMMPSNYWNTTRGHPYPATRVRTDKMIAIPGFGTILGSPTHENFGRSGRYQWIMPDEFAHVDRGQIGMGEKIWAATTQTCRSRRPISTPAGRSNKFAEFQKMGKSDVFELFTVRWHDDPLKMVGAYRLTEPKTIGPVTLQPGDWWSPWAETSRTAYGNDRLFAQEILLSYEGVGGSFYEALIPTVKHEQVKHPVWVGNIRIDESKSPKITKLVADPEGFLTLWELPTLINGEWRWPQGWYIHGIDVASGGRIVGSKGASSSVVVIGRFENNKVTKIGQYKVSGLMAHLFSRVVHAIGLACPTAQGPAKLIWERNGPGETMGNVLLKECGYPGHRVYWEHSKSAGCSVPGFAMTTGRTKDGRLTGSKVNVFNNHIKWMQAEDYTEPSADTCAEMEQYVSTDDGGAEHVSRKSSLNLSSRKDNHGDTVIGTVLMIWEAKQLRDNFSETTIQRVPPRTSMADIHNRVRRQKADLWR